MVEKALTATDSDYETHFSKQFLIQVPATQLRQATKQILPITIEEIVTTTEDSLVVLATGTQKFVVSITVDPAEPHLITGLRADPAEQPAAPTTWDGVDALLAASAPAISYLVSEVNADGSLTTIKQAGATTAVPLGSSFKLYVLGALVNAIETGKASWDEELTIKDELKSLPSGELQDRPDGSKVTVREAAEKMIQISDNTATDLLINRLGIDKVEAMLATMGMSQTSQQKLLPFMTTRQLFTLKWGIDPAQFAAYKSADLPARREILKTLPSALPSAAAFDPTVPVAIYDVEWFATLEEISSAHHWLDAYRSKPGFEPLNAVLGTNPGVALDPAVWSSFAFKGGSEPGVLFLGWLLHRKDDRTFFVAVSATNPSGAVEDVGPALAAQGIIELVAKIP